MTKETLAKEKCSNFSINIKHKIFLLLRVIKSLLLVILQGFQNRILYEDLSRDISLAYIWVFHVE